MTFAGFHQAILYGGISFVTTLQAAITAHCQMFTHHNITAFAQIRTSSQIIIFHLNLLSFFRVSY
jgi:hypothetical protein